MEPTRGTNIVDLVITKDPDIVHEVQLLDSLAASDHWMITWKVDINRPIVRHKKVFDYNKGDYKAIKQRLNGTDWNEYLHGDTENRWQTFRNLIHQLQQVHNPLKEEGNVAQQEGTDSCAEEKAPVF